MQRHAKASVEELWHVDNHGRFLSILAGIRAASTRWSPGLQDPHIVQKQLCHCVEVEPSTLRVLDLGVKLGLHAPGRVLSIYHSLHHLMKTLAFFDCVDSLLRK